jgi:hypothetical protein
MPPVEWVDIGYQGVGGFGWDLFRMLLADPRFGLFVTCPLFILALAAPWMLRKKRSFLPLREALFCLVFTLAFVLFFSIVQYTRLQWVTGIRYLAAVFPFIFLPAAAVLVRLPRAAALAVALLSLVINWSMAMVRSQGSVFDNVKHAVLEGLQLPWLTVLGKTANQYAPWLQQVSPMFVLLITSAAIYLVWWVRDPGRPLDSGSSSSVGGR